MLHLNSLQDFPPPHPSEPPDRYLQQLILGVLKEEGESTVEIPSLASLSDFFHCSCLGVYDCLRALKNQGMDYNFDSIDGPIKVWLKL